MPFIGEGDIAAELYNDCYILGADIDQDRVDVATNRINGNVINADCNTYPFPDNTMEIHACDFDAYANPYASFYSFWEGEQHKADTMVLFFTDGEKQSIMRFGNVLDFSAEDKLTYFNIKTKNEKRKYGNKWLHHHVLPWIEEAISPYTIVATKYYNRHWMIYWGILITKSTALINKNTTHVGERIKKPGKKEAKRQFLEQLSKGRSITKAAEYVGYARITLYKWRDESPAFRDAWEDAIEQGADRYEDFLYDAAESGNVPAIIHGLKIKGRYAEPVQRNLNINANAEMTLEDLLEEFRCIKERQEKRV